MSSIPLHDDEKHQRFGVGLKLKLNKSELLLVCFIRGCKATSTGVVFFLFLLTFKGWLATCYSCLHFKEPAGQVFMASASQSKETVRPRPRFPVSGDSARSQQGQTRAGSGLSVNDNIQLLAVSMSHESSCGSQASLVGVVKRAEKKKTKS